MGLRQVEQLLPPLAEPYPEWAPAPEREKRLDHLETRPRGIAPRVPEAQEALAAVGDPHEEDVQDWQGGHGDHQQMRSEEHTSELQSQFHLVCRLLLEKKKIIAYHYN